MLESARCFWSIRLFQLVWVLNATLIFGVRAQTPSSHWDRRFNVPGVDGFVSSIASDGQNLYACGSFVTAGHVQANGVARWDGTNWSALGRGIDPVYGLKPFPQTIAVSGNDIYVGGFFTSVSGVPATNIARWDGTNWFSVGNGLVGETGVWTLIVNGEELYAGGDIGVAGTGGIVKWDGTKWSGFGTGIPSGFGKGVHAIAVNGSDVYAGGRFTSA